VAIQWPEGRCSLRVLFPHLKGEMYGTRQDYDQHVDGDGREHDEYVDAGDGDLQGRGLRQRAAYGDACEPVSSRSASLLFRAPANAVRFHVSESRRGAPGACGGVWSAENKADPSLRFPHRATAIGPRVPSAQDHGTSFSEKFRELKVPAPPSSLLTSQNRDVHTLFLIEVILQKYRSFDSLRSLRMTDPSIDRAKTHGSNYDAAPAGCLAGSGAGGEAGDEVAAGDCAAG
jgi:hypothetical protein